MMIWSARKNALHRNIRSIFRSGKNCSEKDMLKTTGEVNTKTSPILHLRSDRSEPHSYTNRGKG